MALTTIDTYGIKDGAVQIDDIGTLAGNLTINDSGKLRIGTGLDLQLWHDGTNTYIDNNTAILRIQSDDLRLTAGNNEAYFVGTANGAAELYHDGSKKFETSATGNKWHGWLYCDDSDKIRLGNGADLQLFHDGSHSIIQSSNGYLRLACDGSGVTINNADNSETMATFVKNGAVELYYDNSKKFDTTSNGINVTGRLWASGDAGYGIILEDSVKIGLGTAKDLQIYHDGSNSWIDDAGTGALKIRSQAGGVQILGQSNNNLCAQFDTDGAVSLYHNNVYKAATTSAGFRVNGDFWVDNQTNAGRDLYFDESADSLIFYDNTKAVFGGGSDLQIYHDGTHSYIKNTHATGYTLLQVANGEYGAKLIPNGACELYYDNSKKFETTSVGVTVSGTLTTTSHIDLPDSCELLVGNSDDLRVYHNGTNSFIRNNTGDLYIGGNFIGLMNAALNEWKIKAYDNAQVELYYDNTKRFQTSSGGCNFYGWTNHEDNGKAYFGTGNEFQIWHNGNDSVIRHTSVGSGDDLWIEADTNIFIGKTSGAESMAKFIADGAVELYHNNSKKFETTSTGASMDGLLNFNNSGDKILLPDSGKIILGGGLDLQIYHSGTTNYIIASSHNLHIDTAGGNENAAKFIQNGAVELYYDNSKKFNTESTGAQIYGNLRLDDNNKFQCGNAQDLQIYHNGSHSRIDNSTGNLYINAASGETGISVIANGSIDLYYDNSKKFETNSSGCQVTGTLWADGIDTGDNEKLLLGDGDDLQIYHNGSDSFVRDQGTGGLYLTGSVVGIKNSSANENGLLFTENGAVELYYDNSKKLGTASWGTQIFGNLQLDDNNILKLGNAGDLLLYHDGSHSYVQDNGTGDLYVQSNSSISIKAADEDSIKCIANGAVQLFYDNSEKIKTISTGVEVTGGIRLGGGTSSNEMSDYEEGTYTIGSVNPSYPHSSQDGKYIKIGRMCFCYGSVTFGNHTDSAHAGVVNPFTADAGRPGALLVRYTSFSGGYKLTGHVSSSSTAVTFYYSDNSNAVTYGDLQNKRLDFMITYATNA